MRVGREQEGGSGGLSMGFGLGPFIGVKEEIFKKFS